MFIKNYLLLILSLSINAIQIFVCSYFIPSNFSKSLIKFLKFSNKIISAKNDILSPSFKIKIKTCYMNFFLNAFYKKFYGK